MSIRYGLKYLNYMYSIMKSTDYELQYRDILRRCLSDNSVYREDRTRVGCYSIFNQSMEFDVSNRFPILTGRKMFPKVFNTCFFKSFNVCFTI